MWTRRAWLASAASLAFAQDAEPVFSCPMDPEVRSKLPGKCSKCGMALRAGVADLTEYELDVEAVPRHAPAGRPIELIFRVRQPNGGKAVRDFEMIHEKLFHQFLVSDDFQYFAHEHPQLQSDGSFRLQVTLPKPGVYRLLSDFLPAGGTPQMIARTLVTSGNRGPFRPAVLAPDLAPKAGVSLWMEPEKQIAGKRTLLFFQMNPSDGFEKYLGAWGHLLAISNDFIDAVHSHPEIADGGPRMQFNLYFPREASYRVWLQTQRKGVVNTAAFTVPVERLK